MANVRAAVMSYVETFDVSAVWATLDHTTDTWEDVTYTLLAAVLNKAAGLILIEDADVKAATRLLEHASPLLLLAQCVAPTHAKVTSDELDSARTLVGHVMRELEEAFEYQQKAAVRRRFTTMILEGLGDMSHVRDASEMVYMFRKRLPRQMLELPKIQAGMQAILDRFPPPAQQPPPPGLLKRMHLGLRGRVAQFKARSLISQFKREGAGEVKNTDGLLQQLVVWQRGLGPQLSRLANVTHDAHAEATVDLCLLIDEQLACRNVAWLVCEWLTDDSACHVCLLACVYLK
jgi:hypothetical protein